MDSRVTIKEMLAFGLVILSFTVTGIMIMNEDYKKALVSLAIAAFWVLVSFVAVIVGDDNKILDLSNPSLRNPRRSKNSSVKDFTGIMSGSVNNLSEAGVNPKKSRNNTSKKRKKSGRVTYVTSLVPKEDDYEEIGFDNSKAILQTEIKTRKRGQTNIDFNLSESQEFTGYGESVGNMRVYKRGEKIDFKEEE